LWLIDASGRGRHFDVVIGRFDVVVAPLSRAGSGRIFIHFRILAIIAGLGIALLGAASGRQGTEDQEG
jgi:hypothetical protein